MSLLVVEDVHQWTSPRRGASAELPPGVSTNRDNRDIIRHYSARCSGAKCARLFLSFFLFYYFSSTGISHSRVKTSSRPIKYVSGSMCLLDPPTQDAHGVPDPCVSSPCFVKTPCILCNSFIFCFNNCSVLLFAGRWCQHV